MIKQNVLKKYFWTIIMRFSLIFGQNFDSSE